MNQPSNQLLCTFCTADTLDVTIDKIKNTYEVLFDIIYVLENTEEPNVLCCTYNVVSGINARGEIPEATISLHRKKATNTLYTINALNILISELNGGVVDKSYKIPWENYRNTILVTAYNRLKKINTKLNTIVKLNEIETAVEGDDGDLYH
jgi:hypothetical protein